MLNEKLAPFCDKVGYCPVCEEAQSPAWKHNGKYTCINECEFRTGARVDLWFFDPEECVFWDAGCGDDTLTAFIHVNALLHTRYGWQVGL